MTPPTPGSTEAQEYERTQIKFQISEKRKAEEAAREAKEQHGPQRALKDE